MIQKSMQSRSKKGKSPKELKVIRFNDGERIDLGSESFSNLILTKSTLGKSNDNMMGYSIFKPGINTKQKIHLNAEELAYVVSGSGQITIREKGQRFGPGDSLHIPAGVPHGIKNDGTEDVVMVFFFSSPSYPKTIDA
jgi:quercetin dioxygenase-like cupin family protein